jgi:hypothetical protein
MYDTILFKFQWHSAEHEGTPLIKPLLLWWVTSLEGNIPVVFYLLCGFVIIKIKRSWKYCHKILFFNFPINLHSWDNHLTHIFLISDNNYSLLTWSKKGSISDEQGGGLKKLAITPVSQQTWTLIVT